MPNLVKKTLFGWQIFHMTKTFGEMPQELAHKPLK